MTMKHEGLKLLFEEYIRSHSHLTEEKMFFRPYYPKEEDIVQYYSKDDWQRIFPYMVEDDLKDVSTCSNIFILIWCDRATNTPRGMVYFEENFYNRGEILFHGGTWDHDISFFKYIFRSLITLFDFVLLHKEVLSTTCSIDNRRAHRFQESLCFKEISRDETTIYKTLDKLKYEGSNFIKKMRTSV